MVTEVAVRELQWFLEVMMFSLPETENIEPNKQTKLVNWPYHQRNMVPSVTKLSKKYIYQKKISKELRGIKRN